MATTQLSRFIYKFNGEVLYIAFGYLIHKESLKYHRSVVMAERGGLDFISLLAVVSIAYAGLSKSKHSSDLYYKKIKKEAIQTCAKINNNIVGVGMCYGEA
ncbi:MAG TPA: hypothetical protein VJH68_01970 [Candidatus Nanoarchaeia archaeon]|nr:hypothetical protein [Candidatus Nanoarchaeia archaeon]